MRKYAVIFCAILLSGCAGYLDKLQASSMNLALEAASPNQKSSPAYLNPQSSKYYEAMSCPLLGDELKENKLKLDRTERQLELLKSGNSMAHSMMPRARLDITAYTANIKSIEAQQIKSKCL